MIFIYWDSLRLGSLVFKENYYIMSLDSNKIAMAKELGCPVRIFNKPNSDNYYISKELPSVFKQFLFSDSRKDLYKEFNINISDNDYLVLYKIAKKSDLLNKNEFWISLN